MGLGFIITDIQIFNYVDAAFAQPLLIGAIIFLVVIIFLLAFIFPVLAKFNNTIRGTFKNALFMGIGSLPWTVCILFIMAIPFLIVFTIPASLSYIVISWLVLGFSVTAFINSYIFNRIFRKYFPELEEEIEKESGEY